MWQQIDCSNMRDPLQRHGFTWERGKKRERQKRSAGKSFLLKFFIPPPTGSTQKASLFTLISDTHGEERGQKEKKVGKREKKVGIDPAAATLPARLDPCRSEPGKWSQQLTSRRCRRRINPLPPISSLSLLFLLRQYSYCLFLITPAVSFAKACRFDWVAPPIFKYATEKESWLLVLWEKGIGKGYPARTYSESIFFFTHGTYFQTMNGLLSFQTGLTSWSLSHSQHHTSLLHSLAFTNTGITCSCISSTLFGDPSIRVNQYPVGESLKY